MAAAHIEQHLHARSASTPTQMRRYWLHQANLGMNQLVIKQAGGRRGRRPIMAPHDPRTTYANTASAGSIIAFHLPPRRPRSRATAA
jgi:beta-ketodecanoyl-[acyl-carrier-protein] synthase